MVTYNIWILNSFHAFYCYCFYFTFLELVEHEYKIKPKQIEMHILPLLLHLLNCVNGSGTVQGGSCSLRQATTNLISALSQQMGPSLMEKFSQLVDVTPRHQQYLQDIMNHTWIHLIYKWIETNKINRQGNMPNIFRSTHIHCVFIDNTINTNMIIIVINIVFITLLIVLSMGFITLLVISSCYCCDCFSFISDSKYHYYYQ